MKPFLLAALTLSSPLMAYHGFSCNIPLAGTLYGSLVVTFPYAAGVPHRVSIRRYEKAEHKYVEHAVWEAQGKSQRYHAIKSDLVLYYPGDSSPAATLSVSQIRGLMGNGTLTLTDGSSRSLRFCQFFTREEEKVTAPLSTGNS